jgi:hypothetical protein
VQIYQASQLYDVIASLYFPLNPGIYNGTVPGGQNSLTIQNASFWQFQYQDPVNGTITIPPYTMVAFTVNPGQAYTITPQWALVDTAVTGVLVLPYGWLPADVSVSGNYSPIALAPSVTNTWPYVQSPVTVAGEFGPSQADVEVQMRPPQQSKFLNAVGLAGGAQVTVVAGVSGQSIRVRQISLSWSTAIATVYNFQGGTSGIQVLGFNVDSVAELPQPPWDLQGLVLAPGEALILKNTFGTNGPAYWGNLTYDQF